MLHARSEIVRARAGNNVPILPHYPETDREKSLAQLSRTIVNVAAGEIK